MILNLTVHSALFAISMADKPFKYQCLMSTGRETIGKQCFSAPRTAPGGLFIGNSWCLQLYLELLCPALAITSLNSTTGSQRASQSALIINVNHFPK